MKWWWHLPKPLTCTFIHSRTQIWTNSIHWAHQPGVHEFYPNKTYYKIKKILNISLFKKISDFTETERRGDRETSICCSTDLCIHWCFSYVLWPGIKPAILLNWDNGLTNWATWPGLNVSFLCKQCAFMVTCDEVRSQPQTISPFRFCLYIVDYYVLSLLWKVDDWNQPNLQEFTDL